MTTRRVLGMSSLLTSLVLSALVSGIARAEQAAQPPPTPQQRVAMLQQWLHASQQQLTAYEWIETTTISLKGEVKSHKQNTCYYGVDGKLQKVPIASADDSQASAPRGPLRKKLAAQKKEEVTEYMQRAAQLVEAYLPPNPDWIGKAVQAGHLSVNPVVPNVKVRVEVGSYLKAGDKMGFDIAMATNQLLGISVASYLDQASDTVTLDATMAVLPDGTIYTAHSNLVATAEGVSVVVENTGHRKTR